MFFYSSSSPIVGRHKCVGLCQKLYTVSSVDSISDYNGCDTMLKKCKQMSAFKRLNSSRAMMGNYSAISCSGSSQIQMYLPM